MKVTNTERLFAESPIFTRMSEIKTARFGKTLLQKMFFAGLFILQIIFFVNAAFAQEGLLDTSFNGTGKLLSQVGASNSYANDAVLQPDGKIVIAGNSDFDNNFPGNRKFTVARYNSNGTLDATFGSGGVTAFTPNNDPPGVALGVALGADGKIVAVGYHRPIDSQGIQPNAVVARYNSDGTLDTTFDGDGYRTFNLDPQGPNRDFATDVVVQSDGKIVFAHLGFISGANPFQGITVIRLNTDGSFDNSFGSGGKYRFDLPVSLNSVGTTYKGAQLALRPNGKIVVSTTSTQKPIVQINADGTLDTLFGTGGFIFDSLAQADSIALQADGKIVTVNSADQVPLVVRRYNADGSIDNSFGSNGRFSVTFVNQNQNLTRFFDIAVQPDGKIVIGGDIGLINKVYPDFALARLNTNGTYDNQFGLNGRVTTEIQDSDFARSVLIQPDGKILLVGESKNSTQKVSIVRYLSDTINVSCGSVRTDFDGDGKSDLAVFTSGDRWQYRQSTNNTLFSVTWGDSTYKLVPADYNGDCRTDYAAYKDGTWYIKTTVGSFIYYNFGNATDIPVPADYDGDGSADPAVFRNGIWYIQGTRDGFMALQFGISTDKPVPADYDGDGKADIAVYRNGYWYLQQTSDGFAAYQFGLSTDTPVIGDYDGDGKTDIAVFRPSNSYWYIQGSMQGFSAVQWGISTDKPVPDDYDGDGKTDIGVYRSGNWYLLESQSGFQSFLFGTANDRPIQNVYVP